VYAKYQAVRDCLNCARCQYAELTQEEKDTLDGRYCFTCRKNYGYDADYTFDDNSRVLKELVMDSLATLAEIPVSGGIAGSKTPWAGRKVKPDMAFHFGSLIVVIEADNNDGHSVSRGNNISNRGLPGSMIGTSKLNVPRCKQQHKLYGIPITSQFLLFGAIVTMNLHVFPAVISALLFAQG
jgi:hypothetical protein